MADIKPIFLHLSICCTPVCGFLDLLDVPAEIPFFSNVIHREIVYRLGSVPKGLFSSGVNISALIARDQPSSVLIFVDPLRENDAKRTQFGHSSFIGRAICLVTTCLSVWKI